jgi:hypothetical protein
VRVIATRDGDFVAMVRVCAHQRDMSSAAARRGKQFVQSFSSLRSLTDHRSRAFDDANSAVMAVSFIFEPVLRATHSFAFQSARVRPVFEIERAEGTQS